MQYQNYRIMVFWFRVISHARIKPRRRFLVVLSYARNHRVALIRPYSHSASASVQDTISQMILNHSFILLQILKLKITDFFFLWKRIFIFDVYLYLEKWFYSKALHKYFSLFILLSYNEYKNFEITYS